MKAWWETLSARERGFIAAGGVIAALFLVYQLMVSPLLGWREDARARAASAEQGYELVARAAASAPTNGGADNATPVRNVLNDTASRHKVSLTFVNALPDGSVSLQAGPVDPENAFALFAELQREYAVRVVSADIARSPEDPGLVRLQATVSR